MANATAAPKFMFKGPLKRRREELAAALVKKGFSPADAQAAVGGIGDGQLLAWLLQHGPDILALVLKLLG